MKQVALADLQESVQDRDAFGTLADYVAIGRAFLGFVEKARPTRIVSPSHSNYAFYQYGQDYGHRITRPLNTDLFIESASGFTHAFERFVAFLADLKRHESTADDLKRNRKYVESKEVNFQQFLVKDLWALSR